MKIYLVKQYHSISRVFLGNLTYISYNMITFLYAIKSEEKITIEYPK